MSKRYAEGVFVESSHAVLVASDAGRPQQAFTYETQSKLLSTAAASATEPAAASAAIEPTAIEATERPAAHRRLPAVRSAEPASEPSAGPERR